MQQRILNAVESTRFVLSLFALCLFLLAASDSPCSAAEFFPESVSPFLSRHCVDCHSTDDPEANLALSDLTKPDADNIETWQNILEQIALGSMPPESETSPDEKDSRELQTWIRGELKRLGHSANVDHKLRSPGFGNYVNHERLFDGSQKGPSFSPSRLWRLNPHVYNQFVDRIGRHLRREVAIHQPFPLDAGKGELADFAARQFADDSTLQLLIMNSQTLVAFQTDGLQHRDHEGKLRRMKDTPQEFESILGKDEPPTTEELDTAIRYQFELLLDRQPTDAERDRLYEFCGKSIEVGGTLKGLQVTLKAIMMQPEAVYRMEIGFGEVDEHGRRRLSREEVAFAIARALNDRPPSEIEVGDSNLLAVALKGGLDKPEDIRKVVKTILDANNMSTADYRMFTQDHKIGNPRVLRFFREFFGYDHAPKVFKDEKRIGFGDRYLTQRMVDDADQLVMHIFDQDRDVLKTLLTTDRYFVAYLGSLEHIQKDMHYIKTNKNDANFEFNTEYVQTAEAAGRHPIPIEGPDSRRYVDFYNLDHETWDYPTKQPFSMPKGQRAGILMHPAWLIAWSGNFDNDPIRRGKWIREHLLADTVPDVPLDVNAAVPEDRTHSLRNRLKVTREKYCWQCHQKMDPLGFPFEQFDDFGRHRDQELLNDLLSIFPERHEQALHVPIDTTGHVAVDDSDIEGEVKDAFELVERLSNSDRVRQSFVRHAFRFWMGRNETLNDSPTLMAADRAYVENEGSMKSLIASLLSSDSFLFRKDITP